MIVAPCPICGDLVDLGGPRVRARGRAMGHLTKHTGMTVRERSLTADAMLARAVEVP